MLCHYIDGPFSNFNTLKSIYYAYFHSIIKYCLIFWGNSSNFGKSFNLQKKIVRIMTDAQAKPHVEVYLNNWRFNPFHVGMHFN